MRIEKLTVSVMNEVVKVIDTIADLTLISLIRGLK